MVARTRTGFPYGLALTVVLAAAWAGSGAADGRQARAAAKPAAVATRIVSVVPAVTEMLFAIGAGPRVVGVSSYDTYPPEAASRSRVGALLDPDVERILSLKPDLVVTYATQTDLNEQLGRAGVAAFAYRHQGLADVTATMRTLGVRLGLSREADALAATVETRIDGVRRAVAGRTRPRVLLVFGREPLALRNVYASGGTGFLHDMLTAAGGDNVVGDVARESVQATTELILARAPEVIVELRYGRPMSEAEVERERASWSRLPGVPAVKAGRVVVLVGDEFVVPGPRVAGAIERLARALHPGAWPASD